jgi:non-specific serine/threonine protein kinase
VVSAAEGDRLESWKEIAVYLNRSVRTVRRWEAAEGLPVHRHMHRTLGSVYAFKSEIDAWQEAAHLRKVQHPHSSATRSMPSIVVLPFANLSPERENEYFAEGLTDEVIQDLSKIRSLRVISRTSSMLLKGTTKDVKTIGRELGVRFVLEGTLRRAASRLRISARLINASTDEHLWAEKYDGTVEDVFTMQERLARTIVEALQLQLTADEHQQLAARPIDNVQAYECYLQARQEAYRWRRDAIDHAIQLLHNGLAVTGENAELYAALGRTHLQYREAGIDLSEHPLREADKYARKVFALDPQFPAGLQLRSWIHYSSGRIQEAVRDLKAAHQLDPNHPDTLALLCNCYLISGYVSYARPLIAHLVAVDPLTPLTRCMPGFADLMEGNFTGALGPYQQMFEMDPANPMARLFYLPILAVNGRMREVREIATTFPPHVKDTIPARLTRFLAHALAGDRSEAMAPLTPEIEAIANATDLFPRFLAIGYAAAGVPDRAIHWLSIAVDRGFINYPFLAHHDPFMRPLRTHPEFQQLLATVRERWERFEP